MCIRKFRLLLPKLGGEERWSLECVGRLGETVAGIGRVRNSGVELDAVACLFFWVPCEVCCRGVHVKLAVTIANPADTA